MKREKIAQLLPEIYQATVGSSGPLDGFLAAQERLHAPAEAAIGRFPQELDPRTASAPFVCMLAYWTDLDYLLDGPAHAPYFTGGVGRLRELVASTARNGRERGTAETLIRFLQTATGCSGFRVATDPRSPFHFELIAPEQARTFERLVKRIVAAEKPAFATCEVRFAAAGDAADSATSAADPP
jgi:hypothetical protein